MWEILSKTKSKKAELFQDEVFEKILPSIRKTGTYSVIAQKEPEILLPSEKATKILKANLDAANLLEVPKHISQIEAVKEVKKLTSIDYSPLLLHAPAQDNIQEKDKMLEPSALGKLLGVSGTKINTLLEEKGLQYKEFNGKYTKTGKPKYTWRATLEGKKVSTCHQWFKNGKSDYNYKWKINLIEDKDIN